MEVELTIMGAREVANKLRAMGARVGDARPAYREMANLLRLIESKVFSSQGRRGGGSWKGLTAEWLQRKTAKGQDARILHGKNLLLESLTVPDAQYSIVEVNKLELKFGTSAPGAAALQRGAPTRNLRARPFLKTTKYDRSRMTELVKRHVQGDWGK